MATLTRAIELSDGVRAMASGTPAAQSDRGGYRQDG
jgi:hypothetical protein